VECFLSDKTGALVQNGTEQEMIYVGTISYVGEAMDHLGANFILDFYFLPRVTMALPGVRKPFPGSS